ncbi:aldehyde dehydrogenase family protein [Rhodococcus sp. NPDC127530]|uniref:aldehyde dehydrogenase family protein n=1 Tax=unclassified Rhodococcus (in: high G+C Gram-positive bacteria) TaxID=192944 RepID=UPI0036436A85
MTVVSYDARLGQPSFNAQETESSELDSILEKAARTAEILARTAPAERRTWLYALADALEAAADEVVVIADRETGAGEQRLRGELARTAQQLRYFGDVVVEGSCFELTRDETLPDVPPLVRINHPLGPVAVFGASNFPFFMGVLGNDTASALASGCPVVTKVHSAHLELGLRLAEIAQETLRAAGAPDALLQAVVGRRSGIELVKAPQVSAVGFTGSQAGGLALWRAANDRDRVIPVYAEMGTVNPVVVTPDGAQDMEEVASRFVAGFTLGFGQYCTKPGLLFAPCGVGAAELIGKALKEADPEPVMLTQAIASDVAAGVADMVAAGAELVTSVGSEITGWSAPAAVLTAPIEALTAGSRLLEETFGAVAVVVEYDDEEQLIVALRRLQPSLAASVLTGGPSDSAAGRMASVLAERVGRVIFDGWAMGASVTWAQQHGGPWPSTSAPSTTSLGAYAIGRFVRPIAYQSGHDAWLPEPARSDNPWSLPARIDGVWTPA